MSQIQTEQLVKMNAEERWRYLSNQVKQNQQIWILTDQHGAVMLTTEDDDCLPVWPNEELAMLWATEEWQHCTALAISAKDWNKKWVPGLTDDELSVAVFPVVDDLGAIAFPNELVIDF